jgi:hypothetical protein
MTPANDPTRQPGQFAGPGGPAKEEAAPAIAKQSRLIASVLSDKHRHHLCAFFHDHDEEFRRLLPFVVDGLAAGEKAIHIVNAKNREEHREWLRESGIDVEAVEQSGQLEVVEGLSDGRTFDRYRALKIIDHLLSAARQQGFRQTRFVGFMDWTLEVRSEDLIAFETLVTPVFEKYNDPVICAYDLSRFNGADVIDVLRIHPAAFVGGVVQQNPFYIPAEQMLEKLRERGEVEHDGRER